MAKVPTKEYDARLPNVRVTPRNLGAAEQAQMRVGDAINNIAKTVERHADENRATEVEEYRIKANEFFVEDFRTAQETKGKGALGTINRYDDAFDDSKTKFMEQITDGKVRDSVNMLFDSKSQIHRGQLAQYEAGQRKTYQAELQKASVAAGIKSSAVASGVGEIEGLINEVSEFHNSFNKGLSDEGRENFEKESADALHLSKIGRLAIDNPAMLSVYWDKNKEYLSDRLSAKAYSKAKRLAEAAERDADSETNRKFIEQKNAAINDMNVGVRSAGSEAELLVWWDKNEKYRESGVYGKTSATTSEGMRGKIDARNKALDKESLNRRIMDGEKLDYKKSEYRAANNQMFAEHMALIGDEDNPLKRVGHTIAYFSNKNVTELPTSLTEKWVRSQATGDQNLIKESLVEYSQLRKYRHRMVGAFAKGEIKTRAWWSSLEQMAGALSKSGNIYSQDITPYIEMVNKNVYEVDEFTQKKYTKELNKLKNTDFKDDSDSLYRSLLRSGEGGFWTGVKDWLISQGDESIPEEAWLDYRNLYNQYYKYTGGNAELAKEKAEEDFVMIYGNIIRARQAAMEKANAK